MLSFASNIMKWLRNERKRIIVSLVIGFAVLFIYGKASYIYSVNTQNDIAEGILRFHVLANSDSYEDQTLKLFIRDKIAEKFSGLFESASTKKDAVEIVRNNIDEIQSYTDMLIQEQGFEYTSRAEVRSSYFPTKFYGSLSFPAGTYDSLAIFLGEAEGQNWWCVMFPPLCFVDITKGEITEEAKHELKEILTEDEYSLITSGDIENLVSPVKVKFKIIELWQSIINKIR